MPPPLVEPSRAAHASLGGYLYQVYLGVERWLELGPDEVLRCEGDEDLDRLLLDGTGGVSEQVKALTGKINLRDEVMKGTLRRFVVSHFLLRTGKPPDRRRFVFTSTAERRRQRADSELSVDLLEVWETAKTDEGVLAAVVGGLHTLLRVPEPDSSDHPTEHRFWQKLEAATAWLDAEPARWGDLIGSIRWELEAPGRPDVRGKAQETLRRRGAPEGFFDRLVGEILEASCDSDPKRRLRTREDLESLLARGQEELARWATTDPGRHLPSRLREVERLGELLIEKAIELPPDPAPGKLLSAVYEVIPFQEEGRREILEDLASWCEAPANKGLRLLHGEGGAGKTRLLLEFCRRLRAQSWSTGFLQPTACEADLVELLKGEIPRFAVLDYAESHLESVRVLVSRLANRQSGPKIRVVLLARRPGDWWEGLQRQGDADHDFLAHTPPRLMAALVPGVEERTEAFRTAARTFAERLGVPLPAEIAALDLSDEEFGRPLVLHMGAFLSALGQPVGRMPEILSEVLVHEWRYWDRMARGLGLGEETSDEVREALRRAVVILTLLGGATSEAMAKELAIHVLPAGATESRVRTVCNLLVRLYGTHPGDERFLQALEPDLLGEELVREGLTQQPALLSLALELGTEPGWQQLLTILARLAQKPESTVSARDWLRQSFRKALESLADLAIEVAVTQGDPIGAELAPVLREQATDELAERVMSLCTRDDLQGSIPLREVALAATERSLLVARKRIPKRNWLSRWWYYRLPPSKDDIQSLSKLAEVVTNLGNRRSNMSLREGALEATLEAVALYRRLAKWQPETFLPELAMSLQNLGAMHSSLGQNKLAVEATERATELYRRLARQNEAFVPALGSSLNNLANIYSEAGQRVKALKLIRQSVEIYERLNEKQPNFFLPDLARSHNSLGSILSDMGRHESSLKSMEEAVSLYRRLAESRPDIFLPDLARSLHNLCKIRSDLGENEAALKAGTEAENLYTKLAEQRPDFFHPDLARSLIVVGQALFYLGQHERALEAVLEAIRINRGLFHGAPNVFRPNLAKNLGVLGKILTNSGRHADAVDAIKESVFHFRPLALQQPDVFAPYLSMSLRVLGDTYGVLGQDKDSVKAHEEADEVDQGYL